MMLRFLYPILLVLATAKAKLQSKFYLRHITSGTEFYQQFSDDFQKLTLASNEECISNFLCGEKDLKTHFKFVSEKCLGTDAITTDNDSVYFTFLRDKKFCQVKLETVYDTNTKQDGLIYAHYVNENGDLESMDWRHTRIQLPCENFKILPAMTNDHLKSVCLVYANNVTSTLKMCMYSNSLPSENFPIIKFKSCSLTESVKNLSHSNRVWSGGSKAKLPSHSEVSNLQIKPCSEEACYTATTKGQSYSIQMGPDSEFVETKNLHLIHIDPKEDIDSFCCYNTEIDKNKTKCLKSTSYPEIEKEGKIIEKTDLKDCIEGKCDGDEKFQEKFHHTVNAKIFCALDKSRGIPHLKMESRVPLPFHQIIMKDSLHLINKEKKGDRILNKCNKCQISCENGKFSFDTRSSKIESLVITKLSIHLLYEPDSHSFTVDLPQEMVVNPGFVDYSYLLEDNGMMIDSQIYCHHISICERKNSFFSIHRWINLHCYSAINYVIAIFILMVLILVIFLIFMTALLLTSKSMKITFPLVWFAIKKILWPAFLIKSCLKRIQNRASRNKKCNRLEEGKTMEQWMQKKLGMKYDDGWSSKSDKWDSRVDNRWSSKSDKWGSRVDNRWSSKSDSSDGYRRSPSPSQSYKNYNAYSRSPTRASWMSPFSMIITILCLLTFALKVRGCSKFATFGIEQSTCQVTESGDNICTITSSQRIAVAPVGQTTCFKLTKGKKLVGNLKLKTDRIKLKCESQIMYYVPDFEHVCSSNFYCHWGQFCSHDYPECNSPTNYTEQIFSTNQFLGKHSCEQVAPMTYCFLSSSACMHVLTRFKKKGDNFVTVHTCQSWKYQVELSGMLESNGTHSPISLNLLSGVKEELGPITFNLVSVSVPPSDIFNKCFLQRNKQWAMAECLRSTEHGVGKIGEVRCKEKKYTEDEFLHRCERAEGTVIIKCKADYVKCIANYLKMDTIFKNEHLPKRRGDYLLMPEGDEPPSALINQGAILDVQLDIKDLQLRVSSDLNTCFASFVGLTGCFACEHGASLTLDVNTNFGTALADIVCPDISLSFPLNVMPNITRHNYTIHVMQTNIATRCKIICPGGEKEFAIKGNLEFVPMYDALDRTSVYGYAVDVKNRFDWGGLFSFSLPDIFNFTYIKTIAAGIVGFLALYLIIMAFMKCKNNLSDSNKYKKI